MFACLGRYPAIRDRFNRIRPRALRVAAKLVLFDLCAGIAFALAALVVGFAALFAEYAELGAAGIAAAAVVLAGVVGAVFAPLFAKWFRVTDPVAQGLATGACSHALGTTKAMEMGELQGAMSSIAICVCGIFTSILALFI